MTLQEAAEVIYWQDGSCLGVRCRECPFYGKTECNPDDTVVDPNEKLKRAAKKLMKEKPKCQ